MGVCTVSSFDQDLLLLTGAFLAVTQRSYRSFLSSQATTIKTNNMPVHTSNGLKPAPIEVWRRANAVCFDVDSTLIQDEAIDKLAEYCGVGAQVADW